MATVNCSVTHILQNIFHLCSAEERNSYRFGTSALSEKGTKAVAGVQARLAIGSTGTFPGGLAADLARCPVFFFILFYFIYLLPSQFAKVIISRLWHRCAGLEEGEETARRNS